MKKKITSILAAVAVVTSAFAINVGLQSLSSTRSTDTLGKKAQVVEAQQIKADVVDRNDIKAEPRIGETPNQAPQRVAIQSVDQLVGIYKMTGTSLLNGDFYDSYPQISVDEEVENGIIITDFTYYGWNPLKATVDLSTGAITIPAGQVAYHNTYYDADIYYGTTTGSVDLETALVGTVQADGSITFSQWVAIEFEKGFFQAAKDVVMQPSNGAMEMVTDGETEVIPVWISQPVPNKVTVSHFAGYEDYDVDITVIKGGTIEIPKTTVYDYYSDGTYYDVYTTALDDEGEMTEDGTITGEATEDALTWGAWNIVLTMDEEDYNFYNSWYTAGSKESGKIYYTDGSKFTIPTIDKLAGTGTEDDPFQIGNVEELVFFSNNATDYNGEGTFVKLTDDIDMSGVEYTTPCTSNQTAFRGTFDGDGKTISNLTIVSDDSYVGFIGFAPAGSAIKNLNITGLDIDVTGTYVGGIVGVSQGTIDNCSVETNDGIFGNGYVGGIAGRAASVTNCYSGAYVVSMQGSAGGVAGYLSGTASDNVADGGVGSYRGNSSSGAGGIVGIAARNSQVLDNYSDAYIQSGRWAASSACNGGIVGVAQSAAVKNNVNTYAVIGSGPTGGIVGYATTGTVIDGNRLISLYITRGANIGSVGGMVGSTAGAVTISNGYVDGAIQGGTRTMPNVGGVIGKVISGTPTITNVLNVANVQGTDSVGGAVGQGAAIIKGFVNTGQVWAPSSEGATGGIIGSATAATQISDSYNRGEIYIGNSPVANIVGYVAEGVAVATDEAYYLTDFATPAENTVGTATTVAELAAMGSAEEAKVASAGALRAPSSEVFDFGDEFTLPLLKVFADEDFAKVEAAAVVLMEGTYDNCTYNLRISGLDGIEWSSSADFIEFDAEHNYAYVTTPSTEAITITATSGEFAKTWTIQLNVETGVIEVEDLGTKQIANVRYFNLAGQESSEAFDGVNVVVTRYTDGTQSSVKVLK